MPTLCKLSHASHTLLQLPNHTCRHLGNTRPTELQVLCRLPEVICRFQQFTLNVLRDRISITELHPESPKLVHNLIVFGPGAKDHLYLCRSYFRHALFRKDDGYVGQSQMKISLNTVFH